MFLEIRGACFQYTIMTYYIGAFKACVRLRNLLDPRAPDGNFSSIQSYLLCLIIESLRP